MMKREITCIVCPRGCRMTADIQGETITVTGHTCSRGEKHAIAEILHPVRSLTSIVRVSNRSDTMVSVKSENPIPKGEMFAIMEKIHAASVEAPVAIGDVIIDNICGTRIIATKEIR
jgi:CxxC motif-containing protein